MKKILKNTGKSLVLRGQSKLHLSVAAGEEVWVESREAIGQLDVELLAGSTLHFMSAHGDESKRRFIVGRDARLDFFDVALGSRKSQTEIVLQEEASSAVSRTVFFAFRKEIQELTVRHIHEGRNTRSMMYSRGAVKDSAQARFWGAIQMLPGCKGAEGHLEEHNLLLSSGARIEAIPALEIGFDEVRASHRATLEKVDEQKLFYLGSRGLSEQDALELLVEGFFKDALEQCPRLAFSEQIFKTILRCLAL